ncbi:hypothetical protein [Salinimonas lutimaris]|uniref:hypothetical protein n=1 Tax=Salinimonas lutimaris TaxID=914153 RepID=UPI0010BFB5A2|nr:hypothetical protein [Salinimonas lutimaris]
MSQGTAGIIVLIAIAVLCSLFFQHVIKRHYVAILVSGLVGTMLFQLAAYLHAGYLDSFFLISVFVSFLVICGISSLTFSLKKKVTKK